MYRPLIVFAVPVIGFAFQFLSFERAIAVDPAAPNESDPEATLSKLLRDFNAYSGAELVFRRDDLPAGRYHDVLKPLDRSRRVSAASICLDEARMYPPGFFREAGLKTIGVFDACASKTTSDRSRPFDSGLGGYRYFGVYNGSDAIAAAFYSDGQLALTFHHEVFHHVDSTVDGDTAAWHLSGDDAFYQAAISGVRPHPSPSIAGDDLVALRKRRIGITLKDVVSQYAAKNSREDQAETARHLMSTLPSSLVQVIDQPKLPGSQRILHVLREYEQAVPDGPGIDWFVDVALQRARRDIDPLSVDQMLVRLRQYADAGQSGYDGVASDPEGARMALKALVRLKPAGVPDEQAVEIVRLATRITSALLQQRIRPDQRQQRFDIWGREEANGVNRTLRRDVDRFGNDAKRLALIASIHQPESDAELERLSRAQLQYLRLVARYYVYIRSNWSVTPGTQQVFDLTRDAVMSSLSAPHASWAEGLRERGLSELAFRISADGRPRPAP